MTNIGKSLGCLILISSATVFLSCERYNILWRDYTTNDNDTENEIKLYFMKGRKKREITLYKNRTDGFYVFNTSTFTGFELSGNCFIHIYPFFENKRTSEIFIYDIQIVERNKSSVEMGIKKGASAYFAEFYVDNYHYTVVSRDNVLEINNHQELMNFHDIINNLRLRDYTYRDEGREDYNGFFLCGFVVRSYIDNSFILLKQEYLTRLPEI